MRQLIARIDDELHRRLKQQAAAEGRSLNALVEEFLQAGIAARDERELVRRRADMLGLGVTSRRRRAPSRDAAIASTRGLGRVASRALDAERRRR
jgi:plasmid stability protein